MKVEEVGDEEPEYVVVGLTHGDEPCGKKAIERVLSEDLEFKKPVKFVLANEEAFEAGERFLEADLNRSFPGNSESDLYEERLASKVMKEIEGKKVLDIHSTNSQREPFATFSNLNETTAKLLRSTGVENAVLFPEQAGTLNEQVDGIIVEVGIQGTEEASERAYRVLKNFLTSEGIIDEEHETSNPEIFSYYETVEGDWTFKAENFRKVEKGEIYASREGEKLEAEEEFYPVLMSTNGYDGMLGFKAENVGRASKVLNS